MLWTTIKSRIEYLWRRNKLMNDRAAFDAFVYTDVDVAIKLFHKRKTDLPLQEELENFFEKFNLPSVLAEPQGRLVLFRHVATPNIEASRFLIAADAIGIEPLFFEYFDDKFTPNNDTKRYLGKLAFYQGTGKKGGHIVEYEKVIDFNQWNGKKIASVETLQKTKLTDFHHSLFPLQGHNHINARNFFNASDLLKDFGGSAKKYYINFLGLFISNCILFENFVFTGDEKDFTNKVFLRSFIQVKNTFRMKPIIVAISPTDLEHHEFWLCYSAYLREKLKSAVLQ